MSENAIAELMVALGLDVGPFSKGVDAAGKKLGVFSGKGAAIGASLGAIGGAALEMGQQFAEGSNAIIAETGASGDALKGMQDVMTGVAGSVPESMDKIGTAVGTLNQRLDLTGPALQDATKASLDFARMTKTDVTSTSNEAADALQRLGMSSDQLPELYDKATVAFQKTGISADELFTGLAKVGPQLQQLGFNTDQSIALLGAWSKAGGDASQIAVGMNKAFAYFSKEGATDAASAMQMFMDQVKSAPTDEAATVLATKVFGAKVGPALALQIRSGKLSLDDLTKAVQDSGGALDDETERTKTWKDRFDEFFNGIAAKIGPITGQIGELGMGIGGLGKVIAGLGGLAGGFAKVFKKGIIGGWSAATRGLKLVAAPITNALAKGLAGLAGSPAISGAMSKLGGFMGSSLGGAMKTGFIAAGILGLIAVAIAEWGDLQKQIDANKKAAAGIDKETGDYLAGMPSPQDVQAKIDALKQVPQSLDGVQSALYNLGSLGEGNVIGSAFDALFGANPAQVADDKIKQMEDYLKTTGTQDVAAGVSSVAGAVTDGADAVGSAFDQYVQSFEDGSKQVSIAGQSLAKFDPDTQQWLEGRDFTAAAPDMQASVETWIAAQNDALATGATSTADSLDQYVKTMADGTQALLDATGSDTLAIKDATTGQWDLGPDIDSASADTQSAVDDWIATQNAAIVDGTGTLTSSLADLQKQVTDKLQGVQDAFDLGIDTKKKKNISGAKRLQQMADDIDTITKRLHESIAANDPVNTAYWEQALITATGKYDAAKDSIGVDSDQISADLASAGVDASQVFKGLGKDATKAGNKVNTAADSVNFDPAASNVGSAADAMHDSFKQAGNSASSVAPAINSYVGVVTNAARNIASAAGDPLSSLASEAYGWGSHMADRLVAGMKIGNVTVSSQAAHWANLISNKLGFSEPPPEGPLHDVPHWGPHMIDKWIGPMEHSGLPRVERFANRLAEAMAGANKRHKSADWYDTARPIGKHDKATNGLGDPERADRHRQRHHHVHNPALPDPDSTGEQITINVTVQGNIYGAGGTKQLATDLERYIRRSQRGGARLVGAF